MPRVQSLDQLAAAIGISPDEILNRARAIAHKVSRGYDFAPGPGSWEDMEGAALLRLAERLDAFAPEAGVTDLWGAFWGYAARDIETACVRAADEIRGGGTTKGSVRPENRRTVGVIGEAAANIAAVHPTAIVGPDPISRIKVNETIYAMPFERLFDPLTGQELAGLETDIEMYGILEPLLTCTLPDLGPAIIDGANRAKVAAGKGLWTATVDLGLVSWEFAEGRCRAKNVHRRHLTPERQRVERGLLNARMVEDRRAGHSLRVIAAKHGGLHVEQVRRALKEAGHQEVPAAPEKPTEEGVTEGVTTVTPEEGMVLGADGKQHRSTKPPPTPAELAARAGRSLDTVFRLLTRLIAADRDRLIALADRRDLPFEDVRPGHESWPALETLAELRILLSHVA